MSAQPHLPEGAGPSSNYVPSLSTDAREDRLSSLAITSLLAFWRYPASAWWYVLTAFGVSVAHGSEWFEHADERAGKMKATPRDEKEAKRASIAERARVARRRNFEFTAKTGITVFEAREQFNVKGEQLPTQIRFEHFGRLVELTRQGIARRLDADPDADPKDVGEQAAREASRQMSIEPARVLSKSSIGMPTGTRVAAIRTHARKAVERGAKDGQPEARVRLEALIAATGLPELPEDQAAEDRARRVVEATALLTREVEHLGLQDAVLTRLAELDEEWGGTSRDIPPDVPEPEHEAGNVVYIGQARSQTKATDHEGMVCAFGPEASDANAEEQPVGEGSTDVPDPTAVAIDLSPPSFATRTLEDGPYREAWRSDVTVRSFAAYLSLEEAFLENIGVVPWRDYTGRDYCAVAHFGEGGELLGLMQRVTLAPVPNVPKYLPIEGRPGGLYGQERLQYYRNKPAMFLTEGVTDTMVAWRHGLPSLGIAGAGSYRAVELRHVANVANVFISTDADPTGTSFAWNLAEHLRRIGFTRGIYVLDFEHLGVKDLLALHRLVQGDHVEFRHELDRAMELSLSDQ